MKNLVRVLGLLAATSLLGACGLFGDKEDELLPMELVDIDESIKVQRIWTAKLGGDSEFLRLALRPVGDGNRIYAASQKGVVFAFDPASGRVAWQSVQDLAGRMA